MNVTLDDLQPLFVNALGVRLDSIKLTSTSSSLDGWDSLGHLALLSELDRAYPGVTSRVPGLGTAQSVSEILDLLQGA